MIKILWNRKDVNAWVDVVSDKKLELAKAQESLEATKLMKVK